MQVLAALCFLVLAHLPPLRGEVVKSFENNEKCKNFFYKGMVPKWDRANPNTTRLCQRFKNRYHFATLYNKYHRIAVYSAYRFQTSDNEPTTNDWCIEPQLVDMNWTAEMKDEGTLKQEHNISMDFGQNQSLNADYMNSNYDRGHLNPNGHHSGDSRQATFTLTNVVPQNPDLNQNAWRMYESQLTNLFNAQCAQAYVLVGAIPSANNWIIKNKKLRVNIPDYFWNAYCCLDKKDQPIRRGGATAPNTEQANVTHHTLSKLEEFLRNKTKSKVLVLFRNNCEA